MLDQEWLESMDLTNNELTSQESPSGAEKPVDFSLSTPLSEHDFLGTDNFSDQYFDHFLQSDIQQSHMTMEQNFGMDLQAPPEASTTTAPGTCTNPETCMILGLNTLRGLHIPYPSSFCIVNQSTAYHQPRMVDEALSNNENALDAVKRIAECPCISKRTVRMLLLVICEKLISWNAIILCDQGEERASAYRSLFETDGSERLVTGSHMPVRVGQFSADASLGGRIRACIVVDTLERLQTVLGDVLRDPFPGDVNSESSNGVVEVLDRRLKDLKAEAASRLQDDRRS